MSGFRSEDLPPEDRWKQIENLFPADLSGEIGDAIFGVQADELVIKSASQAALMFGSLSPSIDESDARTLAQKLVQFYDPHGESSHLSRVVKDVPVEGVTKEPGSKDINLLRAASRRLTAKSQSSCQLQSRESLTTLDLGRDHCTARSVGACRGAGWPQAQAGRARQRQLCLSVGPDTPIYARPRVVPHPARPGLCATLAWLQVHGRPVDVEKRANAFAAMLLMPTDLVGSVVRNLTARLNSPGAIGKSQMPFRRASLRRWSTCTIWDTSMR